MARLFVRLKLALLGNGFRRGWQQAAGLIVAALYTLPAAGLGARALGVLGRRPDAAALGEPVLVVGFSLFWLGWTVFPLFAFGMDETLDPGRLKLLPLRRRQLMTGLLAASSVGIGPLATAILLYGVVVGFSRVGLGALIVVAAAIVQFLLCVTTARAVTTTLSRRLASRRGRDVITVAAAMLGLVLAGIGQLPNLVLSSGGGPMSLERLTQRLATVADVLGVLPPGWAARAVAAGSRGEIATGILWLAAALAALPLLLWWWAASLERGLDAVTPAAASSGRDADLFPRGLGWLPRTRFGAGVAKDVRYAWRVPQLRTQYLMLVLMLVAAAAMAVVNDARSEVVLLSPVALLLLGTAGFNLFGADRGAVWLLEITGPRPREDLLAKIAVTGGMGLAIVIALVVVLAAVTGGWSFVVPGLLLAIGVQGAVIAVGVVVSVMAPFPLPESPVNMFAANSGVGCLAVLLQGLGLGAVVILLAPVAAAIGFSVWRDVSLLPAAVAAVVWGIALAWIGLTIASRRLAERGPELVSALQPRNT